MNIYEYILFILYILITQSDYCFSGCMMGAFNSAYYNMTLYTYMIHVVMIPVLEYKVTYVKPW